MPSKAEPYGNYTVHAEINTLEIECSIEATRQQKTGKKNNPVSERKEKEVYSIVAQRAVAMIRTLV